MKQIASFLLLLLLAAANTAFAQQKDPQGIRILGVDSVAKRTVPDSTRKKHNPRTATIRSAILPGWGQAYNRKYWKIPIVYGALGITASVFSYNIKEYHKVRFAYITLRDNVTADFPKVAPELQPFITANDLNSLRNYRTEFRKNIDYSVLFFLLFWGLNVVDATVDGHLKEFDVGNDLSLNISPSVTPIPNTIGLSFVFSIGKNREKVLSNKF